MDLLHLFLTSAPFQSVLKDEGFNAISIHGNKSQRMRENALGQFRNGEKDILVATEVYIVFNFLRNA